MVQQKHYRNCLFPAQPNGMGAITQLAIHFEVNHVIARAPHLMHRQESRHCADQDRELPMFLQQLVERYTYPPLVNR